MENEKFTCTICLDKFIQPRITECSHSFCENCLFTFVLETQKKASFSSGTDCFECPVCRKQIQLPLDKVTKQWISDTFRLNLNMMKIMEIETESRMDIDKTDLQDHVSFHDPVMCAPCKESGTEYSAVKFCLNCCEALCKTCCEWHKKFKLFKQHKVVSLSSCELFKSQEMTDTYEKYTKCSKHADKDIMAFCKRHRCLCCLQCVSIEHRVCEVINSKDIGDEAESKVNIVTEMYTNAQKHIDLLLKLDKNHTDSLLSNIDEVSERIRALKDELISKLNEQYSDAMSHLKDTRVNIEGNTDNSSKLIEMRKRCEKNIEFIEALKACESNEHVFILSRGAQSEFSDIETELQMIDTQLTGNVLTLEISDGLQQLKEQLQTHDNVFRVKLETVALDHTAYLPTEDLKHDFRVQEISPLSIDAHELSSPIFSSIVVNDENIVLFDSCSSELYSYNLASQETSRILVTDACSVLQIDINKLIISMPELFRLYMLRYADGNVSRTVSWKLEAKPYVICHVTDNKFVASTNEPAGFLFFTISELNLLQTKYVTENNAGKRIKATEYFAVDVQRSHLIQTCMEPCEINSLTFDGEEVFCFRNSVLECPQGVTLDKNGNIYVCNHSYFKPSVIVISAKGTLLNVIDEGIPKKPMAIYSDKSRKRFWLTSNYIESSAKVYGFELVKVTTQ